MAGRPGRANPRRVSGHDPAARTERASRGLHLRSGRARLRPHLQGDRAGQLRAGRPPDARRLHLLHVRRLVRRGLLDRSRPGGGAGRALRRRAGRDDPPASHRPAPVLGRHAHDRSRRDLPELRVDRLGLGDLYAADPVQCARDTGRRDRGQPRIPLDHRGHGPPLRSALRVLHVHAGRPGHAGRLAESTRRLLHGHSRETDVLADLGDLGRCRGHRGSPAGARVPDRHQPRVHRAQGVRRGGAGRLRLDPRRAGRRHHHRAHRAPLRRLPAAGVQGRRRVRRPARRPRGAAAGNVRQHRAKEGLSVRFIFKTSYTQDLGIFRDDVQRNWYLALLVGLLVLPLLIPAYLVDVSLVFIYGLCGLSLMVLAGYTGLVSLGHAAFLGIGAYTHGYAVHDLGLPWIVGVALACMVTSVAGVLVGLPALRMTGVYLSIATLAFALIIQEVLTRWERVTGGLKGKPVDKPVVFGVYLGGDAAIYFLCLVFLIAGLSLTGNLLRSRTGRAWVAIRDS